MHPKPVANRLKENSKKSDSCSYNGSLCIEYQGFRDRDGYGRLKVQGRYCGAHRLAWQLKNGPIDDGLYVCHHCDNPSCINVAHLFLGTNQDNLKDRDRKGHTAIGDRHGTRLHPETRERADKHWTHRLPHRVVCGEYSGCAKLTAAQVREIRRIYVKGSEEFGCVGLSSKFGVGHSTIWRIVTKRNWKSIE